jgi:hypothetical protein
MFFTAQGLVVDRRQALVAARSSTRSRACRTCGSLSSPAGRALHLFVGLDGAVGVDQFGTRELRDPLYMSMIRFEVGDLSSVF